MGSEISIAVGGETLTIQGEIVDTVGTCLVHPFGMLEGFSASQWREWYLKCRVMGERTGVFEEGADGFEDVWWRLLVCDSYYDNPTDTFKSAQEGYGAYYLDPEILHQERISDQQSTRKDAEFLKMQEIYEVTRQSTSTNLNFCATKKGLLGWVLPTAREGDKICVFAGARVPFIIRDRQDGTYELLGDAYIHGIMHGEAMNWEGIEWEDIKLT